MAAPPEPSFWQQILAYQVVGELIAFLKMLLKGLLMSAPVTELYRRVWAQSLKLRELVIRWLLLGVFFFFALVAFTTNSSTITIHNEPGPMSESWPPGLTKTEIDSWADSLKPFRQKVNTVLIVFGDATGVQFAATLTQAISDAEWPEPSILPNNLIEGARIAATKDAWAAAQQLQKLVETKTGPIRLDHYPDKDRSTGKPNVGVIAIYAGLKPL
jgi:hypothetical protein